MAYETKYQLDWTTPTADCRVEIQQFGHSGSVVHLSPATTPFQLTWSEQNSDDLTIPLRVSTAQVRFFGDEVGTLVQEVFDGGDTEWRVKFWRDPERDGSYELEWEGYLATDLWRDNPHLPAEVVELEAIDGLALLENREAYTSQDPSSGEWPAYDPSLALSKILRGWTPALEDAAPMHDLPITTSQNWRPDGLDMGNDQEAQPLDKMDLYNPAFQELDDQEEVVDTLDQRTQLEAILQRFGLTLMLSGGEWRLRQRDQIGDGTSLKQWTMQADQHVFGYSYTEDVTTDLPAMARTEKPRSRASRLQILTSRYTYQDLGELVADGSFEDGFGAWTEVDSNATRVDYTDSPLPVNSTQEDGFAVEMDYAFETEEEQPKIHLKQELNAALQVAGPRGSYQFQFDEWVETGTSVINATVGGQYQLATERVAVASDAQAAEDGTLIVDPVPGSPDTVVIPAGAVLPIDEPVPGDEVGYITLSEPAFGGDERLQGDISRNVKSDWKLTVYKWAPSTSGPSGVKGPRDLPVGEYQSAEQTIIVPQTTPQGDSVVGSMTVELGTRDTANGNPTVWVDHVSVQVAVQGEPIEETSYQLADSEYGRNQTLSHRIGDGPTKGHPRGLFEEYNTAVFRHWAPGPGQGKTGKLLEQLLVEQWMRQQRETLDRRTYECELRGSDSLKPHHVVNFDSNTYTVSYLKRKYGSSSDTARVELTEVKDAGLAGLKRTYSMNSSDSPGGGGSGGGGGGFGGGPGGSDGGGGGSSTWDQLDGKPFSTVSDGLAVRSSDLELDAGHAAGDGLSASSDTVMDVNQTVARTDRDEVFSQDVAMDDGAGTGGLLRGDEGTVEVRKQGSPTQYGRLRAAEVEVVDGNTATELRSQVVEISDSLLETNTDASADAWGGLYTYRGRKEDATGTGLISKGIAWSPAAGRFGQVDVDARKNDAGDNVGSGVQTSTFAPYARVNRQESITKDWTFGGDIGTSDFVSRTTGWEIQQGGIADFRKMWADELKVQAFTADVAQALAGTEVLTKSRAKLAENFTVPPSGSSATLTVEDIDGQKGTRAFEAGDTVRLRVVDRSGGGLLVADVWGTVSGYTDHGDGTQSWTYSVTDDGAADGKVIYEGAVALDWGTSGDGQIYSTVLDDAGSPYTDVRTWSDSDGDNVPDSYDTFVRLGVLSGISGLSGEGLYTRRGRFTDDILIGSLDKTGEYLEADGGTVTLKGTLNIIGGSGVSNLSDAGALATEDAADYNNQVSGGPPSDATKGAIWDQDLDAIPNRFGDAPEGSGLFATAEHFGYYSGTNWASVLNKDGSGSFAGGAIQWDEQGRMNIEKNVAIGGRALSTEAFDPDVVGLWHFDGSVRGVVNENVPLGGEDASVSSLGVVTGSGLTASFVDGKYDRGLAVEKGTENLLSGAMDVERTEVTPSSGVSFVAGFGGVPAETSTTYTMSVEVIADEAVDVVFTEREGSQFIQNKVSRPGAGRSQVEATMTTQSSDPGLELNVNQNDNSSVVLRNAQIEKGTVSTACVDGSRSKGAAAFRPEEFSFAANQWSISFNAYIDPSRYNTNPSRIVSLYPDAFNGGNDRAVIRAYTNGDLLLGVQIGSTANFARGQSVSTGWHHILIVRDGDTYKLYVDGRFYKSVSVPGNLPAETYAHLGRRRKFTDQYSNTRFDELVFWDGALTDSEARLLGGADTPLQESPQSAASIAQDLAERYADGQIGALGGLDQIQDTTYIEGGLIDTGLLDTDAVTADKLFVDKTMTENILAENATITGTLTMGSGSSPGTITNQGSDFQLTDQGLDLLSAGGKEGSSAITFYDGFNGGDYKGSLFANNDGIFIRGDLDANVEGTNVKINAASTLKLRYSSQQMLDLDDFLLGSRANDPGKSDLDPSQGMFYVTTDLQTGIAEVKVAVRNSKANGNGQVFYDTLLEGSF